jgi:hypothetical protein
VPLTVACTDLQPCNLEYQSFFCCIYTSAILGVEYYFDSFDPLLHDTFQKRKPKFMMPHKVWYPPTLLKVVKKQGIQVQEIESAVTTWPTWSWLKRRAGAIVNVSAQEQNALATLCKAEFGFLGLIVEKSTDKSSLLGRRRVSSCRRQSNFVTYSIRNRRFFSPSHSRIYHPCDCINTFDRCFICLQFPSDTW